MGGSKEWISNNLQKYKTSIQHFLEHLLVLVHVSVQQHKRGKKILGTRYLNTLLVAQNLI